MTIILIRRTLYEERIYENNDAQMLKLQNDSCKGLFVIYGDHFFNKTVTVANNILPILKNIHKHRESHLHLPTSDPFINLSKTISEEMYFSFLPEIKTPKNSKWIKLSYLTCGALKMYSEGEVANCLIQKFRKENLTNLQIVFMGDSKLRQLYTDFLFFTRKLNYTIIVVSITWSIR